MKKLSPFIAALVACLFIVGCDPSEYAPIISQPSEVTTSVTVPAETNDVNGTTVITPEQTIEKKTVVNLAVPNPKWTTTIETLKGLNSVANPTPFAPLVTIGLTGLSALLALIAGVKNKKLTTAQAVLNTVVKGVEIAAQPGVKQAISDLALAHGTSDALHTIVQAVTNPTGTPKAAPSV